MSLLYKGSGRSGVTALCSLAAISIASGQAFGQEITALSPRYEAAQEAMRAEDLATGADASLPNVPSRIRVRYRDDLAATAGDSVGIEDIVGLTGSAEVADRELGSDNTEIIVLDRPLSDVDLERITQDLERDQSVQWAEIEKIERAQQADDPMMEQQWHLLSEPGGVRAPEAWPESTGRDVVVAVLDSGFRIHEDIKEQ